MSLKKIDQIKQNKFFKVWDLLIYGLLAVLIVVLFLAVFLTSDTSALRGVDIYYNGNLIFTYSFEEDSYEIYSEINIVIGDDTQDGLTVYFTTDDGNGHNTIYINKSKITVKVTESDCSNRKDCVYTAAIKNNSTEIICTPHKLEIKPSGYQDPDDGENIYM